MTVLKLRLILKVFIRNPSIKGRLSFLDVILRENRTFEKPAFLLLWFLDLYLLFLSV
jgi:hypothetical protein